MAFPVLLCCCLVTTGGQRLSAAMKPSPRLAALALALCLGCTLVAANDLQVEASVLDCYGK